MMNAERIRTGEHAPERAAEPGWAELTAREREEAKLLAETLNPDDASSVVRFGSGIQQEIADFASSVLEQVRTRDAGDLGETINGLVAAIRQAPQEENEARHRLLASIPAVGKLLGRARRSLDRTRSVDAQVEAVSARLDEAYVELHRDIEMLDQVLKINYEHFRRLDVHIAAARLRLKQAADDELPGLHLRAEEERDPWDAQRVSELQAFIRRLELRLDDFRRTRYLSLSQAPRIRMLQQSGQIMMEKIQSVLYNLIPLWKMDLVTGIAQHRAARALEVHERVRDGIESSLRRSAERTRLVAAGMARESEGGMIGMDTLRSVHGELIAALEETAGIYAEGRKQRSIAEQELAAMEGELKRKLAEIANKPIR